VSEAVGTGETLFIARPEQVNSVIVGKGMERFRGREGVPFYGANLKWSALHVPKALARCLFIYPGVTSPGWASLKAGASNEATYMSHGMAYVSSALKARGHLAWLLDMRSCRSWPDFARRLAEEEYDVAFLGFLSHDAFTAAGVVRVVKEVHPSRPLIVGGLHVSVCEDKVFPPDDLAEFWLHKDPPQQLRSFLEWKCEPVYQPSKFPKADCVIWNEAEIAACALAEKIAAGESIPDFVNAGNIPDLNETPHADRDLFDCEIEAATPLLPFLPRPFFTITFGRGCPFRCGFSFAASTYIETDRGVHKIDDLVRDADDGIECVQHDGTYGRIVAHSRHLTRSRMVSIRAAYLAMPLRVTEEHIVHVRTKEGVSARMKAIDVVPGMFVEVPLTESKDLHAINLKAMASESTLAHDEVDNQTGGSFKMRRQRSPNLCQDKFPLTPDGLRFLGLYMSEGTHIKARRVKSAGIGFTFAKHERDKAEWVLGFASRELWIDGNLIDVGPVWQVRLGCPGLGAAFYTMFGDLQRDRRVPRDVLNLPAEKFLAFARGWLEGDGYGGAVRESGDSYAQGVTSSASIAFQMFRGLWSSGVPCALQRGNQPKTIMGRSVKSGSGHLWTVRLLRSDGAENLCELTWPGAWHLAGSNRHEFKIDGRTALLPVVDVTDEPFDGEVYDVEVVPTHTLTANGIAADNCNIAVQLSSSSVRLIKPDYFLDELQQLHDRFGRIGSLMIHDDILLYPKWLATWNAEIRKRWGYVPYWCQMRADFICKFPDLMREMAEAGMSWVSIGLESGSQRLLDLMVKQTTVEENVEACAILERLGVNVFGNWMLGIPTETPEDVKATADMMRRIKPGFHSASIYCDYPGTSLSHYLKSNGLLLPEWYTLSHYPWQRRVKGVDYELALRTRGQVTSEFPNRPQRPKLWPEGMSVT